MKQVNHNLMILLLILLFSNKVSSTNQVIEDIISKNWDNYSIETVKLLYSENEMDYYRLGMVFLAHYDYSSADKYLNQSAHENVSFYLALSAYNQNKLDLALKHIKKYFEKHQNSSSYSLYFDILNDMGNMDSIELLFQKLEDSKIIPTNVLLYKKGKHYFSNGNCSKAIEIFTKVLNNSPTSTTINKLLSKVYFQCNEPSLAKEYMEKESTGPVVSNDKLILELYEYGNPAHLLKPKLQELIKAKDYNVALEIVQKLIDIQPNDESLWINYGSLLNNLNHHKQSLIAYEKAHEINPKNILTIENIVKTHWGTNKDIGNQWLDKLLLIKPNHRIALRAKGDYLKSKGDTLGAIKFYTKSLNESPEDPYLLNQLTLLYLDQGNHDIAIKILENAFKIKNNNDVIASYLARTLMIALPHDSASQKRALRISRNIYQQKQDYTYKFTLLMALRLNDLNEEADKIHNELMQIPLRPSQKKYKDALESLKQKETFIKDLGLDWLW